MHIHTETFEGPLALLLHLIRKEEMDIFDINIHHITQQYFEYIRKMKELDLEVAGEFVAMAATLIQIKSRMLLPQYNDDGEEIETEDPRKELVQKLLEYQKFKEAAEKLYDRPLVGRDVFLRGSRLKLVSNQEEEIIVEEDNALFALISCYRIAIRNVKKSIHRVTADMQSVASRILQIKDRLLVGRKVLFRDLIDWSLPQKVNVNMDQLRMSDQGVAVMPQTLTDQILITFLSLLELGKMGFISLFQSENFGDIHITATKPIERNVIDRVEDYDHTAIEDEGLLAATRNAIDLPSSEDQSQNEEVHSHQVSSEDIEEKIQQQLSFDDGLPEEDEYEGVDAATDEEILAEEEKLAGDPNEPTESSAPSALLLEMLEGLQQENTQSSVDNNDGDKNEG